MSERGTFYFQASSVKEIKCVLHSNVHASELTVIKQMKKITIQYKSIKGKMIPIYYVGFSLSKCVEQCYEK